MKSLVRLIVPIAVLTLLAFNPNVRGQTAPTVNTLHNFTGTSRYNPRADLVQGSDGSFYGTTYYGGSSNLGTVFKITAAGALTTLHSFTGSGTDGVDPSAGLVQGSDGSFYGTTYSGGSGNLGTVFKITAAGALTTLHSFTGSGTDGAEPRAGLVQGSDGSFYGTTYSGGSGNLGTVFKITAAGALTTLHSFTGSGTDGVDPSAGLVQGSDGNFYGTTYSGGSGNLGTVFKITAAGALTTLHSFTGSGTDGATPFAGLVQGSDGSFYGTTAGGGSSVYAGTVFKITVAGVYTTLYSFTGSNADGASPLAGLVQGSDGSFYGTTAYGGSSDEGTIFKITVAGVYTTLHSFTGSGTDGAGPFAGLVQGSDGSFYGTAGDGGSSGDGTVFKITAAGVYTALHGLTGSSLDGDHPEAGLVRGSDGSFYGTTRVGGGSGNLGTVFKITAAGVYTTLHSFTGTGTDGAEPRADLIQGSDGSFYGTTYSGGSGNFGTVFKITDAGIYTTLHSFTGSGTDGAYPEAGLVQSSDGSFYGTTGYDEDSGDGTVFKITAVGALTTLHSFTGSGTDGAEPRADLIQGSDGSFYGTTYSGGSGNLGTVFKITAVGALTTLHSFTGSGMDGFHPSAGLVQGSDGNFYGTTVGGGSDHGTVFKITAAGALTTLHSFTGSGTDGAAPLAHLIQGSDGSFYGTTQYGGSSNLGTVFKITSAGALTTLHSFIGSGTDGVEPFAGLIQDSDGNFYGTTYYGGSSDEGTVFKLVLPKSPVITSATGVTAIVGQAFTYQITATNNPTSYATSSIPPGLSFSTSTGKFMGTPTTAGTYKPLLSAISSAGKGSINLNLFVTQAAPVITSATNATATVGNAFTYQVIATNNPTSYATSSIPPGLSFSTSTGKFTGTPTKAGTYKPLLSAINGGGKGSVNLSLVVKQGSPIITSALTETSQVGVAFIYQVTATNSPTKYAISSLPPGLTFDTTKGKLTGTPTKAGSYRPLISATNSGGTGSANVDLTVKPAKPVITSELNPPAQQGVAFSYQITATNSPTSFSTSSIPPGLSFSASTGKFTGTPTKVGTYKPLISATNSGGTASVNLNLVVKSTAN